VPSWARLLGRLSDAGKTHAHGIELGYLGLVVHHVGDGLGLGAYGGGARGTRADVLLALAVHTVPLVAVVTFALRDTRGKRAAVLASAGLAIASIAGVLASGLVSAELVATLTGWIAAGVAGLLVHVVTHDLGRDLPETAPARLVDLGAGVLGVVMTLGAADEHGLVRSIGRDAVMAIQLQVVAPSLVAAVLAATLLGRLRSPLFRRWLAPLPGPAYGLDGALCAAVLGGVRFGILYFVGLLLVTRAIALGGAEAPAEEGPRPWIEDALERLAVLLPWSIVGVVVSVLFLFSGFRLAELGTGPALALALLVALPTGMAPVCAVLIVRWLDPAGLSPSTVLAFAVVASTPIPVIVTGRSRARAAWAILATLLVGVGIGLTPTGALEPGVEAPEWLALTALALLVPPAVWVLFRESVRGLLLLVFPSHDSAPAEHAAT
jgi:hypothetical protein